MGSKSPEFASNALFGNKNPIILYLRNRDYSGLLSPPEYKDSYIINHMMRSTFPIFNDTGALIYYLENITPPAEKSRVVLVLPLQGYIDKYLYAYDILLLAKYNYTTAFTSDIQILGDAEIIVLPSEKLVPEILELKNTI